MILNYILCNIVIMILNYYDNNYDNYNNYYYDKIIFNIILYY